MIPLQNFSKKERLCSRKQIQEVFESGASFFIHPFKIIFQEAPEDAPSAVQVLISVPKRNIRKAVMRNKIKRRIREAYRKNKSQLLSQLREGTKISIIFIFTAKEELPYQEIETKIIQALQRLPKQYAKNNQ
jgi:ribonuclease P protein component